MNLRVRSSAPAADGTLIDVTPQSAGWAHVGFRVIRLEPGQSFQGGEEGREACLVILSGRVSITAGDARFARIGSRASVFDGPPTSVYVPAGLAFDICAESKAEIAICSAPGTGAGEARLIGPETIR